MSVPFTRTLPYVLREQLQKPGLLRFVIAEVTAIPDGDHVTIGENGSQATVPRLSGYTPTVGEPAYCLAADTIVLAIGAVGGVTGAPGPARAAGPAGPEGPAGTTGAAGAPGVPGTTGAQGPKGDTGATGTGRDQRAQASRRRSSTGSSSKAAGGAAIWAPIAQADLPAPLGESAPQITDWNTAITTGWYGAASGANQPPSALAHFVGGADHQLVRNRLSRASAVRPVWRRGLDAPEGLGRLAKPGSRPTHEKGASVEINVNVQLAKGETLAYPPDMAAQQVLAALGGDPTNDYCRVFVQSALEPGEAGDTAAQNAPLTEKGMMPRWAQHLYTRCRTRSRPTRRTCRWT